MAPLDPSSPGYGCSICMFLCTLAWTKNMVSKLVLCVAIGVGCLDRLAIQVRWLKTKLWARWSFMLC